MFLFSIGAVSVVLSIWLTVSSSQSTSPSYMRRIHLRGQMAKSYQTYSRGWRLVTTDEFEDVRYLNAWLGEKYPSLSLYWNKRMLQYLQQRLDTMELL